MSDKSNIILNDAYKNGGKITRTRAIELIGHHYYFNGPKYVSEVLTRLVNSGKLTRVGRGNYELSKKASIKASILPEFGSNQIKLL